MRRPTKSPKRCCAHYREMMSECRNCDKSDAPYKICYKRKNSMRYSGKGKIIED